MIKSIRDLDLNGKRALIRVDFNVPIDEDGKVTDDKRVKRTLPTIDAIIDAGGIPVIMSHLGRPKGGPDPKYSLKPVSELLINKYGYKTLFADDCIGEHARKLSTDAVPGEIVLLENVRFHPEETKNDIEFAKQLSLLGDIYINDAFGSAHRAHSSTAAVASFFAEKAVGYLMKDELDYLGKAVKNPLRPFTAILGGAKVSDKIAVIENLIDKCDNILIGGGMAFTFIKALGYEIGSSLLEEDKIELTKELMAKAKAKGVNLLIPSDVVVAKKFEDTEDNKTVNIDSIPAGEIGLDIGEKSIKEFSEKILNSKTVVWNGPMGVFEMKNFAKGTFDIAQAVADATTKGAITIIGGGDSASAIKKLGFEKKVSYVSTGGGASLEYLEGKELPGVKALEM
jgi:phosphoglycerate kinase